MMNIHTTQNLNSLVQYRQSTNHVSSRDFRSKIYSEQMPYLAEQASAMQSGVSFKGKGSAVKDAKKIIKLLNKKVGDIAKETQPEVKRGDKLLNSPLFNKIIELGEYEPVVQAALAAIICIGLRPATILALPSGKSKQDNTYAASHSIASGIVGLIATILLTTPFKAGANYVMKDMLKNVKEDALKRLYPHLNIDSIKDAAGKRKEVKEWIDVAGNKFSTEIKDVSKLPKFSQLADVSEITFEKILKTDVDWAAQKGKSFNDVTLRNGKKLYDAIDMKNLGIVVNEEGINEAQILLRDLDKEYLTNLVKDSKDNYWGKLNIKSVYDEAGKVKDFREWKDIDGKQWKLDLDTAYVSSPLETADYRPRITGKKRYDAKEGVYKFTTYQKNGVEGKLGTEITSPMVEAEARNEGHTKLLTWLPDLAFRIPIAATTIALIPWILKSIFHIEKTKKNKTPEQIAEQQAQNVKAEEQAKPEAKTNEVNFKGKGSSKASWFARKFGEWYGKPLLENEGIAKLSDKLAKLPGNITQHMATLGSLITSSVYVERTLTNKDLDVERRRTLAINQILCFFIPTIAAYTVDSLIKGWTKSKEYRYSGLQEQKKALAEYEGKAVKGLSKDLGKSLKGVRILASLATFTLIYRYATPVLITPIANWLGDKLNTRKAEEARLTKETSEDSDKKVA